MESRESALSEILSIAARHTLTSQDIAEAMNPIERSGGIASKLLAYVGGILMLASLGATILMFWDDMNIAAHLLVTLGVSLLCIFIALLLLKGENDPDSTESRLVNAVMPLFLVGFLLQPMGMMVAFDEWNIMSTAQLSLLLTTLLMLAQSVFFYWRYQRDDLLFVSLIYFTLSLLNGLDLQDASESTNFAITGFLLLPITYYFDQTDNRRITPFWYLGASSALLWAVFELLEPTRFHVIFVAVAILMTYFSTLAKSRLMLFVSTSAMLCYLAYFTNEYFVDSIGWPIALMLMGVLLIGFSSLALRISNKFILNTGVNTGVNTEVNHGGGTNFKGG